MGISLRHPDVSCFSDCRQHNARSASKLISIIVVWRLHNDDAVADI